MKSDIWELQVTRIKDREKANFDNIENKVKYDFDYMVTLYTQKWKSYRELFTQHWLWLSLIILKRSTRIIEISFGKIDISIFENLKLLNY